jgi:ATP-dependent DNA helicase 2 subunit 1
MLTVHEDEDTDPKKKKSNVSAVRTALECAYAILQQRIIASKKDMMGILLYGTVQTKFIDDAKSAGKDGKKSTKETKNTASFEHCYVLMDVDVPDAESIKNLKNLLEDEDAFEELMVPSKTKVSMANVLFGANRILTTRAPNFGSRRLFIVTDEDDPHAGNHALQTSAIWRAKDLYDLRILIEPFFITNPGQPEFDSNKFWNHIVYRSPLDYDDRPLDLTASGKERLRNMISSVRSKAVAKRALFSTKLELGPGLTIGIKGFLPFKKQEKERSYYIYTGGEKVQIVSESTTVLAEATAKVVDKAEVKKAYKFGGEQVVFTQEEMKQMRNFGEPGIRIIGFKSSLKIKFDQNVRSAIFIYPDEKDYVGSIRTFTALHKKLVESKRVGLCWCIQRRNSAPVLCAMVPSTEEVVDGRQTSPDGFFLLQLPFADDLRLTPETGLTRSPPDLIDRMRAVVKQLHMPRGYDPEKYENPALQWHYRILQAIALDEELPEKPDDKTLPKYRLIDRHAGGMVEEWSNVLENHKQAVGTKAVKLEKGKRVADDAEDPAAKKARMVGGVKEFYKSGQLGKCTVAALREFCRVSNLDDSGKKAELVERVEEFLDNA